MLDQQMLQTNFPSNRSQGYSSREKYDKCYNNEQIERSVGPLLYRLNPNQVNNCNSCLSVFGPRASGGTNRGVMGYGDSSATGIRQTAPAQALVDVDSVLSNRNVIKSKCKDSSVNPIDVSKFNLQHPRVCNDWLDPIASHLTNPAQDYREVFQNRFIDLGANPQEVIYYDVAINTSLESRDNYRIRIPNLLQYDATLPKPV
jgi:hypothetical protein